VKLSRDWQETARVALFFSVRLAQFRAKATRHYARTLPQSDIDPLSSLKLMATHSTSSEKARRHRSMEISNLEAPLAGNF
jgi:hypothetical protein